MNQEKWKKEQAEDKYKVDNERIEKLMKGGFLFGFSGSDLFILLAALLTLIFFQLQPYLIPYLEGQLGYEPTTQAARESTSSKAPSTATDSSYGRQPAGEQQEDTIKESTESGRGGTPALSGKRIFCPSPRAQVCTLECIIGSPFICGSDGKSHCSVCHACADPRVEWYIFQDEPCPDFLPSL